MERNTKFIDENNRIADVSENSYDYLKELNRQVIDLANEVINKNTNILQEENYF